MAKNAQARRARTPRRGIHASIASMLLILFATPTAHAQGVRGALDDLVRGAAKVADDIPVKKMDDLVADLAKSRGARDAVDMELRKAGQLAGNADVVRGVARSEEVLRLLRSATSGLDPNVMRRVEQLDDASRDVALVLVRGGDELTK